MRFPLWPSLLLASAPAFACDACGCATHTDWASQGLWSGPGLRMSLRYEYIDDHQLRSGLHAVDRGAFPLPAAQEVQQGTLDRTLALGLDWSPTSAWGLSLAVPYLHRTHETIGEGDTETSASRHVGLGDLRLVGRYLGWSDDRSFGVQFGLKLPTGRTGDAFASGPQAGVPVDRGLQCGTGTTDVILGLFKFGSLSGAWSYFAQGQWQAAMGPHEGFRPGHAFTGTLGLRHAGSSAVQPQLQLNVRAEKPETGPQADTANTGATQAYLSPGLTAKASARLTFSAFVQIPVYQRVTGLQLEPKALFAFGVHYAF